MEPRILLVEGQRKKNLSCGPWLEERGHKFDRVHTRRNASAWLKSTTADLLIIDARALRFDAHRFCQALRANGENVPLLLILPAGEKHSGDSATVVLQGKITPRRFYNRVRRLLSKPGAKVLRAGEIVLDIEQRVVTRGQQQHRLTPRQTALLAVFMRNPGRVLTRARLMREVWDTDFVDDTRTLEVHVHWLRKAIEKDPSHPVYLVTVRRLGYRFDVPPAEPQ